MVMGDMEMKVDLLVIGAGPGGYAAAFRAADLGLDVALVDSRKRPGGVCLYEGCIPSKTCLYLAELIMDADRVQQMGVHFSKPDIHLEEIRAWKEKVVSTMAEGLVSLCERRSIQRFTATATFTDPHSVRLQGGEISRIHFKKAIIAAGSRPTPFPTISSETANRIMSSREALDLVDIPKRLLVVGGGYVGLELGYVYAALGSKVHMVEVQDTLLSMIDQDLVVPLQKNLARMFEKIDVQTTVESLEDKGDCVEARLAQAGKVEVNQYDRVLIAMGRKPVSDHLGLENTRVAMDDNGYIQIDSEQRTTEENIFAVGDVCGGMMLAHTAMRQGRVAAEAAAGHAAFYDVRAVPAVVYTDPQLAWCGLTEKEAKRKQLEVSILKFPWKYSGRAQSMGTGEGLTKIVATPEDGRILGVGICGRGAEGLIAEAVLAIEMGAVAEDLALSLHPHPTLSETIGEGAEIFLGSPTHLLPKKRH